VIDEVLSQESLESSPWIKQRIKELKLEGRLVHGWTPPVVRMTRCSEGKVQFVNI